MMSIFRRYVLHNFWLKVLSILLAVGLWMVIAPDERPSEVAVRSPMIVARFSMASVITPEVEPQPIRVTSASRGPASSGGSCATGCPTT